MPLALIVLLSQEAPIDARTFDVFGAWGVCLALLLAAVVWLARQLAAANAANRELSDRLVAQAEKSIPILERTTAALERREDRR